MSIESHEKALRAASRVAFLALVGCGGLTEVPTGSSDPSDIVSADRSDNVSSDPDYERPSDVAPLPYHGATSSSSGGASAECPDAGGDAAPAASTETDAGTPHELLACLEQLEAHFPNGDPDWSSFWEGTQVTDPELAACCTAFAGPPRSALNDPWPNYELLRNAGCCHVTGWGREMHCTPWGPPMPPAMRGVA